MRTKQWIFTALVFAVSVAPRLVPAGEAGQMFTYVAEEAVFLWYAEEEGNLPDGYHVYRHRVGETTWNRLTREPVKPILDADHLRSVAGLPADVLISMLGGDTKTRTLSRDDYNRVLENKDSRNFLMMLTLGYPGLGLALGQEYVDSQVQAGISFQYRVTVLRGSREDEVAVSLPLVHGEITQLPTPENLVVVEEGDGEVYLDWERNKPRELEFGIVGYNVYRAQGDVTQPFLRVNATPVMDIAAASGDNQSRAFRDDGLANGTQYWYRLAAVNVFGFEGEAGAPVLAVPRDGSAPGVVEDLSLLISPGAVMLQWRAPEDSDIRGYRVFRSVGGIDAFEQIAPTQGAAHSGTVYVDSLLVGELVWYRVQAVDRAGNAGHFSDAVQLFQQDIFPPAKVAGLKADITKAGDVQLSWEAVTTQDFVGYRLQRSTHPSEDDEVWMTLVDELKKPGLTDTLWQLQEGEVTYRVRAQDKSDNRGPWSDWVTVRPPDELPPRPPYLRNVTVEGDQLRLTWRKNQEPDLAGTFVWRSSREEDGYTKITPQSLPDSLTTWNDGSGTLGAVHWYRLSAVDRDGNESELGNPMGTLFFDDVPPPIPENLEAVSDSAGVILTWSPSGAGDLKGYRIYRQGQDGTEAVFYRNTRSGAVQFLDKHVVKGDTYAYQIAAFDGSYNFSGRTALVLVIHEP